MFGMIQNQVFSPPGQVGSNPGVFNPISSVMPVSPGPSAQPSLGNYQWGFGNMVPPGVGQAPATSVPEPSMSVKPQWHVSGNVLPYDTGTMLDNAGNWVQRKGMNPQAGKPTTGAGCRPGMPCWTAGLQNFIGRRMANG